MNNQIINVVNVETKENTSKKIDSQNILSSQNVENDIIEEKNLNIVQII